MAITTAMTTSSKAELLRACHNFSPSGDVFKCALIKSSPSGNYGPSTTNYSNLIGNGDEVIGTGYTAGGFTLTNLLPGSSGTGAFTSFSQSPNWTNASFSTSGCIIYNSSAHVTTNAVVAVYDFGGIQTVASGTFIAVLPSDAAGSAIIQIL